MASKGTHARGMLHHSSANEKFNGHFQAPVECTICTTKQMLKQRCNQFPNAITRSGIISKHLSLEPNVQCGQYATVVQQRP